MNSLFYMYVKTLTLTADPTTIACNKNHRVPLESGSPSGPIHPGELAAQFVEPR